MRVIRGIYYTHVVHSTPFWSDDVRFTSCVSVHVLHCRARSKRRLSTKNRSLISVYYIILSVCKFAYKYIRHAQ